MIRGNFSLPLSSTGNIGGTEPRKAFRIFAAQENERMQVRLGALILFQIALASSAFAQTTADTFKNRCTACHGKTGTGDTMIGKNLKVPDLSSESVQKKSDQELEAIISKGKGKMPGYENKLNKEQIREVVKFIRALKK
jgi:mono/diheme cytochrome c family protein